MTAPVESSAGSRSPAGLAVLVMSLGLGLAFAPPARAQVPARAATSLRLSLDAREFQLRLGTRQVDLGLAVGSQLAPVGRAGMSLAAQLHLGTRDGVSVTASYGYHLPSELSPGRRLLPHGAIHVPLGPRLSITGEGSLLGEGGALGTLGLGYRLDAAGGPWLLSGGLGFTFRRADPDCPGGGQLRVNADWCAQPTVVFGIQRRF